MGRKIYAYTTFDCLDKAKYARKDIECDNNWHKNLKIKVGDTKRAIKQRVGEQINTTAGQSSSAILLFSKNGRQSKWKSTHRDFDLHAVLVKEYGWTRCKDVEPTSEDVLAEIRGEWFYPKYKEGETVEETRERAYVEITEANLMVETGKRGAKDDFKMRSAQRACVDKMLKAMRSLGYRLFLIDAKPRFGKNFTLLNYFKEAGKHRVLLVSYRGFVFSSMEKDVNSHVDFVDDWEFINYKDTRTIEFTKENSIVACSAQLAEYKYHRGNNKLLHEDEQVEIATEINTFLRKNLSALKKAGFDVIVIDEAHFGAQTQLFKDTIDSLNIPEQIYVTGTAYKFSTDERFNSDNTFYYGYIEERLDPDAVKTMPEINLVTYEPNETLLDVSKKEYRTDEYFKFEKYLATNKKNGEFIHMASVEPFIMNMLGIGGPHKNCEVSPFFKYPEVRHVFLLVDRVESGNALERLINQSSGGLYKVINACGKNGIKEAEEINQAIETAEQTNGRIKTITISCNRFNEGVSIPKWLGVINLSDTISLTRYVQGMYRAQTPDIAAGKKRCYVFDYNPQRALAVYYEYAKQQTAEGENIHDTLRKLLDCMPIERYDKSGTLLNHGDNLIQDILAAHSFHFRGYDCFASMETLSSKWDTANWDEIPTFEENEAPKTPSNKPDQLTDHGVSGGKNYRVEKTGASGSFESGESSGVKSDKDARRKLKMNCIAMFKRFPEYIFISPAKEETIDDVFNNIQEGLFCQVTKNSPEMLKYAWDNGFFVKEAFEKNLLRIHRDEKALDDAFVRMKSGQITITDYINEFEHFRETWIAPGRDEASEIGMTARIARNICKHIDFGGKIADIYTKDPIFTLCALEKFMEKTGMSYEEVISNFTAFCIDERAAEYLKRVTGIDEKNIHIYSDTNNETYINWLNNFDKMKFDYIIQNPPYNGSLHLDFLEKGLDLLTPGKGRMVIIEPATWLINLRKYGKRNELGKTCSVEIKKYDELKKAISGHVESVTIDNLNYSFNTKNYIPFATTVIDMSKTYDMIDFTCCGERRKVKSLYDCNLIGEYPSIWSILDKVMLFGDSMNNHITDENGVNIENIYYAKYADFAPGGCLVGERVNVIALDSYFMNGTFKHFFRRACCDDEEITTKIPHSLDTQGKLTNKLSKHNVYGTKEELENWKYNVHNLKILLFILIIFTIDQHNNSLPFLPWLVDRKYTDEEINQMFGFTDEEIALIDRTIKKYERNSPWFKRYMCGPGSVDSDPKKEEEIINNFINNL